MNEEGGDMDEIIERVRAKTLAMRDKVREEYKKGNIPFTEKEVDGRESKA